VEEIECCSTLNVVLCHEIVADLELDGTELGLQRRGECRGVNTLSGKATMVFGAVVLLI